MLEETAAPVVLTQERLVGRLAGTRARIVCLDRDREEIARCSPPPALEMEGHRPHQRRRQEQGEGGPVAGGDGSASRPLALEFRPSLAPHLPAAHLPAGVDSFRPLRTRRRHHLLDPWSQRLAHRLVAGEVEGRARPLLPAVRDEIYRIAREALVNAFRHSGAATIEVEIEYAARQLRVVVRDNGRGIDSGVLSTGREDHWGLSGMRERAERIGARLQVWSRTGSGTEVELTVPAGTAFADLADRVLPRVG